MNKIKSFLGIKEVKEPTTDFSAFFYNASSADKKKLLTEVVREANKDQRALIKEYNQRTIKTT